MLMQIVTTLEIYGVKKIVGIPFGYRGFGDEELTEMPVRCAALNFFNLKHQLAIKTCNSITKENMYGFSYVFAILNQLFHLWR